MLVLERSGEIFGATLVGHLARLEGRLQVAFVVAVKGEDDDQSGGGRRLVHSTTSVCTKESGAGEVGTDEKMLDGNAIKARKWWSQTGSNRRPIACHAIA